MASIQKRGKSYRIKVSCGYDCTGKQLIKSMTWTPEEGLNPKQVERELQRQAVLFEEKVHQGQYVDGSVKLSDFAERWFRDYAEKHLKVTTQANYRFFMRRIGPALGHIHLDKIQPHHLIEFYTNLEETDVRDDTKYQFQGDFKALLKEQGHTKTSFCQFSGVSMTVVTSLCSGRNISLNSVKKICAALGQGQEELFKPNSEQKALADKTILHYHRFLSSMFTTAVQWQVLLRNPCDRIKPPKVAHKEARYLDEKQTAQMLQLLQNESLEYRTIILLLIYSGMRRGELCGLRWTDIDWDQSLIHITRSSLYLPERGVFEDTTKNYSSQRVIKLPVKVFQMLELYRDWQQERRRKLGPEWPETGRIFTQKDGKPIHPNTVTGWFANFVEKNGLPQVSIHSLRHTNATLLIAGGTNIRTVSNRLGHAQTSTTSNIYAHAIRSADEAASKVLDDLLMPQFVGALAGGC